MAGDPAGIGGAPPAVLGLDIEGVLERGGDADLVAAMRVDDRLRLARGARRIEQEQRILGVHHLGHAACAVGPRDGQRH